jgi:predicted nucleic acid-binding protein
MVLDASAALPWCFRDEASPETDLLFQMASDGALFHVPAHWPTEMLGGLTRAARRGRLDPAQIDRFLQQLPGFNILVDLQPIASLWSETLPLVRLHRLSAYDAAYLGLAIRLQLPLATLDDRLIEASRIEGVSLPLSSV